MYVLVSREGQLSLHKASRRGRLAARLRAGYLDRELARGTAPEVDPRLAVRATRIVSPSYRHAIGRNLLRLTAKEPDVEEIAAALLGTEPVPARTVAIVSELIADGTGPLYRRTGTDELHAIIRQAAHALGEQPATARR